MFQQLYAIEARIKNTELQGDEIVQLRQQEAIPVLQVMKKWMTEQYTEQQLTSSIRKAIAYCLPRMDKLIVYTTNARLGIDNNPVKMLFAQLQLDAKITCLPVAIKQHSVPP